MQKGGATRVGALAGLGASFAAVALLALIYVPGTARADYDPPDLHLENLTWPEVERAMAAGFTRVIVPTGGTEQNGLHAVLGKHNFVVRHTSKRIAAALGNALVAPVIAYVPEGEPGSAPTGHMRYPGTLTVPEPVFEALLTAAIESYATHGFKVIYLIGDSGGNQAAQARVAERFDKAGGPVKVHNISDYYAANGQQEWLIDQGLTPEQIGTHAGIRDTSELLAVDPAGVRRERAVSPLTEALGTGSTGDPSAASAEIGQKMLDLKIAAAVRQIRRLEESRGPEPRSQPD